MQLFSIYIIYTKKELIGNKENYQVQVKWIMNKYILINKSTFFVKSLLRNLKTRIGWDIYMLFIYLRFVFIKLYNNDINSFTCGG